MSAGVAGMWGQLVPQVRCFQPLDYGGQPVRPLRVRRAGVVVGKAGIVDQAGGHGCQIMPPGMR